MGGSSFDLIMQEVLKQKQRLDELVEENQDLQRQLADLRAGRGIFLEIGGQQFMLNEAAAVTPGGVVSPAQELSVFATAISTPCNEATMGDEVAGDAIPQTEQPVDGEFASMSSVSNQETQATGGSGEGEEKAAAPSTFLEDLLVDEFASAATNPMLAWKGSPAPVGGSAGKPAEERPEIDEETKAALRRELIGSFLLE